MTPPAQTPGFRGFDDAGRQQCLRCWGWKFPALHSCPGVPQPGHIPPPTPQRIQRRRVAGWRMPVGAVYVGRPGKWGNPYRVVGSMGGTVVGPAGGPLIGGDLVAYVSCSGKAAAVEHSVELYRNDIDLAGRSRITTELIRAELAGRDLACWCPPAQPCHADVLLQLANPRPPR
jgi:hypothetical protein